MEHDAPVILEGVHCTITISRPSERAVLVHISGLDVGGLGARPFAAIGPALAGSQPGMRIFTEPAAFDTAFEIAVRG